MPRQDFDALKRLKEEVSITESIVKDLLQDSDRAMTMIGKSYRNEEAVTVFLRACLRRVSLHSVLKTQQWA